MAVDPQEWLKAQKSKKVDPQEWLKSQQIKEGAPVVKNNQPVIQWRDVPGMALENAPKSFGNVLSGIGETLAHPLDTGKNLLDIAAGGLQNVLPESVNNAIAKIDPGAENAVLARQKANQVGEFYSNRYGSEEGFKQALANDPASVLMDASVLLSGGGALASKAGLSNIGGFASRAGQSIDPVLMALRAGKEGAKGVGNAAANVIGGIGTHTGTESIKAAAIAGLEGGQKGVDFIDNMRGNSSFEDILPGLKGALANMRNNRAAEYKQGMAAIGQDQTVIPIGNIKAAIDDAMNIKRFKGESISPTTEGIQADLLSQYDRWSSLDPAQYHTPEGLDAFKQAIGDIRDSTAPHTPQRAAAGRVYNAVKDEIVKQAPEYAKVMQDYEQASRLTNEIEKSLSLGEKATADTSLRKLQSLTRNNVNTNYGNRLKLAQELENNGATNLTEKLAGQALSTWTPRGLGGLSAMGTGSYGLYAHDPLAIPLLAVQSPRLMGEASYKAGQIARLLREGGEGLNGIAQAAKIDPKLLSSALYQAQQPKD